jgi:hypothetical protein
MPRSNQIQKPENRRPARLPVEQAWQPLVRLAKPPLLKIRSRALMQMGRVQKPELKMKGVLRPTKMKAGRGQQPKVMVQWVQEPSLTTPTPLETKGQRQRTDRTAASCRTTSLGAEVAVGLVTMRRMKRRMTSQTRSWRGRRWRTLGCAPPPAGSPSLERSQ